MFYHCYRIKLCKGPSIKDVSPNFTILGYPPSPCLPTSPLALRPLEEMSPQVSITHHLPINIALSIRHFYRISIDFFFFVSNERNTVYGRTKTFSKYGRDQDILSCKSGIKKTRNVHFHQKMNKYFCDITTR